MSNALTRFVHESYKDGVALYYGSMAAIFGGGGAIVGGAADGKLSTALIGTGIGLGTAALLHAPGISNMVSAVFRDSRRHTRRRELYRAAHAAPGA